MASLLALMAAVFYGAGDFLGGLATRRATMVGAVFVTQAVGLALLLSATPLLPEAQVAGADIAYGALAGLTGSIGVALLYLALAIGPMSVVAPVTAVCSVAIPVALGLLLGERPGAGAAAGVGLAIAAIALLSQAASPEGESAGGPRRLGRGVQVALVSGVAIGGFLAALSQTAEAAGLWPLAVSRGVSTMLFLALALATGRPAGVPRAAMPAAVGCGALDMLANALYLVAVRQGQLGLVATLVSLYPASTVLLARVVLGERLGRWQQVGVVTAVVAIVLIVRAG